MINSIFLIIKLFSTKKQIIKNVIHTLFLLTLFILIVAFSLTPVFTRQLNIGQLENAKWDVKIYNSSVEQFNEKLNNDNLENMAAFATNTEAAISLEGNTVYLEEYGGVSLVKRLISDSFNSIFNYIIPEDLMIDYDESLFENPNSIILSHRKAIEIEAKVGKIIQLNQVISYDAVDDKYELSDVAKDYIVAGIVSAGIPGVDAIILNESLPAFGKIFYNELYIKFRDEKKGISAIDGYVADGVISRQYGDDWKNKVSKQEYENLMKDSYDFRLALLLEGENLLVYSKPTMLIILFISVASVSLIFLNEKNKALKLSRKAFGVYSSFGMSNKVFVFYFFINTLVKQIFLYLLSLIILKNLIYKTPERYLTMSIIKPTLPLFALGFVLTSLVVCIMSVWIVRKEKLLESLNEVE